MWPIVIVSVLVLIIVWTSNWIYKWRNPICNGKLPPGSMGWPLLGETIQFFKPNSSLDIHPFIKDRMKRHGSLFKTSLVGRPVVVSTDPEFSHFIFQQEGNSVEIWYLDSFMKLVGQQRLTSETGVIHKYLRNMIMDHFGPGKHKEKLLSEIQEMALKNLEIWCMQESVEVKEVATTMTFELGSRKLLSYDPSKYSESLKDMYPSFLTGLISFPLNIPGTVFYKCLNDQKRAIRILKDLVTQRLYSTSEHGDLLDVVIEEMKKDEPIFNVESAAHFLFAVLFATFETISMSLTLLIKFLSENPLVMQDLEDEHEKLLMQRENIDSPITWEEYKSMNFTSHVIDETLRLGNIAPLVFRRATRDIHIDGYAIPAGWTIGVCSLALHLDPEKYKDALTFNPWRWKGQGSNTASKNFMAFGGGMRLCAGAEFAKLQMSVVVHFLVTKYRWKKIKGGEVARTPGIVFPNGLHIKVTKRE
ncbi:hypothetical protein ACHQM5_016192 [Ranunculus cassubicifolius]